MQHHDIHTQNIRITGIQLINGTALIKINSIKDLGIIFDMRLFFELHYNYVTSRAYKIRGFISRSLRKFKNLNTYITIYNTYVRSIIIDYGSIVWGLFYHVHINSIERVQRIFTRILFRKFHYPTESYEYR